MGGLYRRQQPTNKMPTPILRHAAGRELCHRVGVGIFLVGCWRLYSPPIPTACISLVRANFFLCRNRLAIFALALHYKYS